MDNKKQPEYLGTGPEKEPINPTVIMGGAAFKLSDLLDENNTEVKAQVDQWLAKKEKAFDKAQKAKARKRITYKKRK